MGRPPTIDMCISTRELSEPQPSPTGDSVLAIERGAGGDTAFVAFSLRGGSQHRREVAVAPRPARGGSGGVWCWGPDGVAIVYVDAANELRYDQGGSMSSTLLVPPGNVSSPVLSPDGHQVFVVIDEGSIWAIDLDGAADPLRIDDGRHEFCWDPIAVDVNGGTVVHWQAWSPPDMPWDHSVHVARNLATGEITIVERPGQIQQLRAVGTSRIAYLSDASGWLNLWLGEDHLVNEASEHGGPTWGPRERTFAGSPRGDAITFTRNDDGFGSLCVVDVATGAITEIGRGVHTQVQWVGDTITALRSGAVTPHQLVAYQYDDALRTWTRNVLDAGPAAQWQDVDLVEPSTHRASGADGVVVPFRRYEAGHGRCLVCVHGGPTDQWQVEFMPRVAYWRSQGWDVIVPDPRGRTGHGRKFALLGQGEWGGADVDDVLLVVNYCQQQGWATPATTVVMGSSSGGFLALLAAAHAPTSCAGVIALYPVCEPASLAQTTHRFEAHYTDALIGPPGSPILEERSVLRHAASLSMPLLLMHGTDDPVVSIEQSRSLVRSVRNAGGDVTYEEFLGEGHGFRMEEHKVLEYAHVAAFLARVCP